MSHQSAHDVYVVAVGSLALGAVGWWATGRLITQKLHVLLALPFAMIGALLVTLIASFPVGLVAVGWDHFEHSPTYLGALGFVVEHGLGMSSGGVAAILLRAVWIIGRYVWALLSPNFTIKASLDG
ncbi:hypothetical protein [Yoonia maritima]|uniref:hypothetical protein n=1 Tax=Yoonia maritima TaxID=1435347 RepID=UPI003736472C